MFMLGVEVVVRISRLQEQCIAEAQQTRPRANKSPPFVFVVPVVEETKFTPLPRSCLVRSLARHSRILSNLLRQHANSREVASPGIEALIPISALLRS
jgi:hypothetical protein